MKDWKTTLAGIASMVMGLSTAAAVTSLMKPVHAAYLIAAGAVSRVYLGIIQKDAQ
jgi:hypothetical protein